MSSDPTVAVVLFSGGLDSTIALFDRLQRARMEGGQVHALTFSYGQRHSAEIGYARTIMTTLAKSEEYAPVLGSHVVHKLHFPLVGGSLLGGEPVDKYADVESAEAIGMDNSFVPYRNLIFLSVGAVYAHTLGAGVLSTGLRGGFPDCTIEFEQEVQRVLNMAVPDYPLTIETPTHASRAECINYARSIPGCFEALATTLTCFEGTTPPCGHCLPCLKRSQGFAAVLLEDPILSRRVASNVIDNPQNGAR
jgi:7-cyano-7-deazaguanine synthase